MARFDADNARVAITWCRFRANELAANLTNRGEIKPSPQELANHLGQLIFNAGLPHLVQQIRPWPPTLRGTAFLWRAWRRLLGPVTSELYKTSELAGWRRLGFPE